MLLTKIVKVKWNGANKKWYESKGYNWTKKGDEFEVKVEDLSKGSTANVDVICDFCGKKLKNVSWQNYLKCEKKGNYYYCNKCAMKLYAGKNMSKGKLKKGKNFEQWCIENNRQDVLERWDYDLNDCKPNEILYSTHSKYYFECPRGIHDSELKNINSLTTNMIKFLDCNQCNSFAQWGIDNLGEDFLGKYWDYEKNNKLSIDPWKISKSDNSKKVWIKCQEKDYHNSYDTLCNTFVKGCRCSYCRGFKVHPKDSLGNLYPQVLNIWSNKNKKTIFEYTPRTDKEVWWRCPNNKHDDYYRSIGNSYLCNFRCPRCSEEKRESILQEKVRLYLEKLNNEKYTILHESNCTIVPKNPKTKHIMPFDNEIKELKLIIEVHGIQHYELCGFHELSAKTNNTTPEYELRMQQVRDRYKRFIAYKNGYKYTAIPYWTDDEKEIWKKTIDNKIETIKKIEEIKDRLLKNKNLESAEDSIIQFCRESHFDKPPIGFKLSDLDGTTYEHSFNNTDRDKKTIHNGEIKYFRNYNKYLCKGKVYHNINNMWWVIINDIEYDNVASFELFDLTDEDRKQKGKLRTIKRYMNPKNIEYSNQEYRIGDNIFIFNCKTGLFKANTDYGSYQYYWSGGDNYKEFLSTLNRGYFLDKMSYEKELEELDFDKTIEDWKKTILEMRRDKWSYENFSKDDARELWDFINEELDEDMSLDTLQRYMYNKCNSLGFEEPWYEFEVTKKYKDKIEKFYKLFCEFQEILRRELNNNI